MCGSAHNGIIVACGQVAKSDLKFESAPGLRDQHFFRAGRYSDQYGFILLILPDGSVGKNVEICNGLYQSLIVPSLEMPCCY